MENLTLRHYGVLGMKWGVRRTEAQLARARGASGTKTSSNKKAKAKAKTSKSSEKPKTKTISEMSDDELRKAVTRLRLEQDYRNLNPAKVSAGQRFVNKVLKDVVIPATTEVAKNALKDVLTKEANALLSKSTASTKKDDKKDNKKDKK